MTVREVDIAVCNIVARKDFGVHIVVQQDNSVVDGLVVFDSPLL